MNISSLTGLRKISPETNCSHARVSQTELVRHSVAHRAASLAGDDLDCDCAPDRFAVGDSDYAAQASARPGAGHRECDADHSQPGAVRLSHPAAFHRRHWTTDGNRRARLLRTAA